MKRMILMAVLVLTALMAQAQVGMAVVYGKDVVDLDAATGIGNTKMRPDTVMPNGDWQRVVESQMSAKESYKYARQVLARIIPNYQSGVQLEDTADCKIIVKVPLALTALMNTERGEIRFVGAYDVKLTLVMKDGRYRVSSESTTCSYKVSMQGQTLDSVRDSLFEMADCVSEGSMRKDLLWKAGKLVNLIDTMLKKQKADDDF